MYMGGYLLEVDGIAYYDVQKDERHVLKQMYKEDVEPVFAYLCIKIVRQWLYLMMDYLIIFQII